MEACEATKIVFSRIQSLEPENVSKIIGYLLLQDLADEAMIRLAFGPNTLLQSIISKAKEELGLSASAFSSPQESIHLLSPYLSDRSPLRYAQLSLPSTAHSLNWGSLHVPLSTPGRLGVPGNSHVPDDHNYSYVNFSKHALPDQIHPNAVFSAYQDQLGLRDHEFQLQDQLFYLHDSPEPPNFYSVPSDSIYYEVLHGSNHRRSCSMSDAIPAASEQVSWKPCVYFARGYCRHGSNCRFSHGYSRFENVVPLSPSSSSNECHSECGGTSVSLDRLEKELQELLRGKRAPLSIAALPQIYYERFGKTLQAEGYLTESQRHGKAGYSLTNLLARLKNKITLIDRPHGQHAIVLAEDAHKFAGFRSERDDVGAVNPGSRQIYMTFPAESTFTEEDVSNYFRIYGPVQDVRIPYQQKRMYGFVTYVYPETVKIILAKGNPHYVCGARVLVKPYKEKSRKYPERGEHSRYLLTHNADPKEYDLHLGSGEVRRHHPDDQEQVIEMERLRFAELYLGNAHGPHAENQHNASMAVLSNQNHSCNGLPADDDVEEAAKDIEDHLGFLLDVLDGEGDGEAEPKNIANNDEERNGHNLPDSPFAISLVSGGSRTLTRPEKTKNHTIPTASPAQDTDIITKELSCSICLDLVVDHVQLECQHAFCIKCIPKGIAMWCPICGQQSTVGGTPSTNFW